MRSDAASFRRRRIPCGTLAPRSSTRVPRFRAAIASALLLAPPLLSLFAAAERSDSRPAVVAPDPALRFDTAAPRRESAPAKVALVAPIQGFASAFAVFLSPASGIATASVTALRGPKGTVPASDIAIRYAQLAEPEPLSFKVLASGSDMNVTAPYHDELQDKPRGNSLNPVWLTVRVREGTQPGVYTGTLSAAAEAVPVELAVAPWTCPPPSRWQTHVGLIPSPETLALRYRTGLWSDAHWTLVEKQMDLMAGLGNDDVWLSVFSRNAIGHERSWIAFTREDGRVKPDLRVVRRYLETYARRVGTPHAVLLEIWNSNRCRGRPGGPQPDGVDIWVDGKKEKAPVPGKPGSDEPWAAVIAGVRNLISGLGWKEELLSLGCSDDARPDLKSVRTMQLWAPASAWAFWTHGRGDPPPYQGKWIIAGMPVGHYEHLFCPAVGEDRPGGICGGWDLDAPEYSSCRNYLPKYAPPSQYRNLAEGTMVRTGRAASGVTRSAAGFTRLPLDFWPVEVTADDGHIETRSLLLLYEPAPWDIFFRNNTRSITAPGPEGPIGTVRYEMLREGLQECEARVTIEKFLAKGGLNADLERRCRTLLRKRMNVRESDGSFRGGHAGDTVGAAGNTWGLPADWRASTLELYTLAAECAATAKERP